jgi:hypothetical protein
MKTPSTRLLISLLSSVLLLSTSACGKKKTTAKVNTATDPNIFVDPSNGQTYGVSTNPHPAECAVGIPPTPGFTKVTGCDDALATIPASEGLCFVQDSVTPTWTNEPPSSGPQYTTPDFQYYRAASVVPRGTYVRSLAHGYVVIVYHCPAGCAADANAIASLITSSTLAGTPVILTEDPLLHTGTRFAAMSWGHSYTFETLDQAKLTCFIQQHAAWGIVDHINGGIAASKGNRSPIDDDSDSDDDGDDDDDEAAK